MCRRYRRRMRHRIRRNRRCHHQGYWRRWSDDMILDIGPQSAQQLADIMAKAGTVVWNGPVGVFEFDQFGNGTKTLAGKRDCRQPGIFDCRRRRHAGSDCQIQYHRQDRLHLHRWWRVPQFLEGKVLPAVEIRRSPRRQLTSPTKSLEKQHGSGFDASTAGSRGRVQLRPAGVQRQ